ncbi:Annexin family and Annexin repeat-containing protein [Strongyloides ratti]|uniref:Annexin n=1 Tax=Strongyloides ratti TaxID=34506 RepID=A0A090LF63_STRRB|nr:Annexin family and Annexin repeat-containing protein [Strongyloides ratti]CEF66763.1 Annexin family and Annexin repeat-containing protein [Strongyloides ratti]
MKTIHAHKRPTIQNYGNFQPVQDAEALRNAMKGFGTNEDSIIRILCKRSNYQRQEIAETYKNHFGRDLISDLKSELRSDFEDLIVALMIPKVEYDVVELHKAISGLGTDENVLVDILCSRNNEELYKIKTVYRQKYGRDLESDIINDTSGYFQNILVAILQGQRPDCTDENHLSANKDARNLYRAGEQKLGTDESSFIQILATRSYCQLDNIFREYELISNHSIEKAIENEFSGDLKNAILSIVSVARNTPEYFATSLYNSMKGLGTKDKTLIRIIVSRSEIDLKDIALAYEKKYGVTLADAIKGETSGHYKNALLSILSGN